MPFPSAQHIAPRGGGFEPQLQNRFVVTIEGVGGNDLTLSVVSGNLPTITYEETIMHYGNEIRYTAGKPTFETMSIIVRDYVDINTQTIIANWSREIHIPETGVMGFAANYKKEAGIVLFAPDGSERLLWILQGVWPQTITYGPLDYATSETVNIDMTLRYDRSFPA